MDEKVIIERIDKYGPKPATAVDALIQAHAFLREEGQWIRGEFFEDGDAKEAYDKASCCSWSACSMGALGLVTGEMPVSVFKDADDDDDYEDQYYFSFEMHWTPDNAPLSYEAAQLIADNIDEFRSLNCIDAVINFNDEYGRDKVLAAFEVAIRSQDAEPLPENN